jgi:hypothetical protein
VLPLPPEEWPLRIEMRTRPAYYTDTPADSVISDRTICGDTRVYSAVLNDNFYFGLIASL